MILSKEELNTARNIVRNITKSFTVPPEGALEIEDQVTKIVRSHKRNTMLKHFKDLGIKVAREHVENRQLFEQHAKGCHNRIEAAGVAICKHPDNKRMGTNYSGCFFDSCPFVMFLID